MNCPSNGFWEYRAHSTLSPTLYTLRCKLNWARLVLNTQKHSEIFSASLFCNFSRISGFTCAFCVILLVEASLSHKDRGSSFGLPWRWRTRVSRFWIKVRSLELDFWNLAWSKWIWACDCVCWWSCNVFDALVWIDLAVWVEIGSLKL